MSLSVLSKSPPLPLSCHLIKIWSQDPQYSTYESIISKYLTEFRGKIRMRNIFVFLCHNSEEAGDTEAASPEKPGSIFQ